MIATLVADVAPSVRKNLTVPVTVMDVLPSLMLIIQPTLRPVRASSVSRILAHQSSCGRITWRLRWRRCLLIGLGEHAALQRPREERTADIDWHHDSVQHQLPPAAHRRGPVHLQTRAVSTIMLSNDTSIEWRQRLVHPNIDNVCSFQKYRRVSAISRSAQEEAADVRHQTVNFARGRLIHKFTWLNVEN